MDGLKPHTTDADKRDVGQHYRKMLSHHRNEAWDGVAWIETLLNAALSFTVVVPMVSSLLGVSMQVSLTPPTKSTQYADNVLRQSLALTDTLRS